MEEKTFKSEIFGLNKKEVEKYVNEMKRDYEEKLYKLNEENNILRTKNEELLSKEDEVKAKTILVSDALIKAEGQAKQIIEDAINKAKAERAQIDYQIEQEKEKLIDMKRKILELKETVQSSLGNFSTELGNIASSVEDNGEE